MYLDATVFKAQCAADHVELPDAGSTLADFGNGLVPVTLEVGNPRSQRQCVMLSQALDVTYLKPRVLHGRHDRSDRMEFLVGPGRSTVRNFSKYSCNCINPTCSNMPTELMASNPPSATSR